ncbi:MAG: glycosyltransferase [Candidatus Electrothrix sp. AW1]|nr:glycosyltransferase [Candidatus Electrothrix sp. AX1]MCI5181172.1 glycosyltransferase [Candidatus Electrothrix gigas]
MHPFPESERSTISVVVPLYNEERNVAVMAAKVIEHTAPIAAVELIFIDDGSQDNTLLEIKKIANKESGVYYRSLSRNFGHQNALRAGLDIATGDAVVTMDGDMQHPPELLPEMIRKWREGYNVVVTVRQDTSDSSWFKRKSSALFYRIMNSMAGIRLHEGSADFRLLDRKVVDALKNMQENAVFYRGLISWVGFRQCSLSYVPHCRIHGSSKYSVRKMFRLALDGMTAFSFLPLRLAAITGLFIAFLAFFYVLYAFFVKFFTDQAISGWLSIMAGIYFLGGIQLLFIGLCGEYIGRIFMEVKGRPHYLISEAKIPPVYSIDKQDK